MRATFAEPIMPHTMDSARRISCGITLTCRNWIRPKSEELPTSCPIKGRRARWVCTLGMLLLIERGSSHRFAAWGRLFAVSTLCSHALFFQALNRGPQPLPGAESWSAASFQQFLRPRVDRRSDTTNLAILPMRSGECGGKGFSRSGARVGPSASEHNHCTDRGSLWNRSSCKWENLRKYTVASKGSSATAHSLHPRGIEVQILELPRGRAHLFAFSTSHTTQNMHLAERGCCNPRHVAV